jgi:hypothetical protein
MSESSTRFARGIVVVVLGLAVLAAGLLWAVTRGPQNPTSPEDAARGWAEKLKLPYRGAACTMFDSDDDGYVSCVLALDGPDKVYFQGLQCGELHSRRGGGCKPDSKNPEVHLVLELSNKGDGNAKHVPE